MRTALLGLLLFGLSSAQDTTMPPGATPLRSVKARGVQIYTCMQQGDHLQWVFKEPEADLLDATGAVVGRHAAGPSWTWIDGSSIRGAVVQTQPSPSPGNIPWLLLSTHPSSGGRGVLSHVTWVRRFATQGGVAPVGGCDAAHKDNSRREPYSATYTFYTEPSQP